MIHIWEAVAEPVEPFVSCHCSAILELDNGDLLVGYYAGSGEARPDAASVVARRTAGSDGFGPLRVVADTPGKPEGNGILYQNQGGKLLLVYGTMHGKLDGPPGPGVRWETCDLRIKTSQDRGETWSDVRIIEPQLGHVPRCKPIRLRSGDLMFATEYKDDNSRIWTSSDDGESWETAGSIAGEPNQHPTLIERADGSILALLRPAGDQGCVLRSTSTDQGRTWSKATRTDLASPCAAIDAVRLADGRIALVWNNNAEVRNPLTLALSADQGETWPHRRDLVTGQGQFHYPALIQSADGLLHVSFTNNRRTIDHIALSPDWIEGQGAALRPWGADKKRIW
jgi:predicted neuraminidase